MEKSFHIHLVSDATGETLHSVARACLAQFEKVEPVEHVWSMIRTQSQMDRVGAAIAAYPGIVLYTLVNNGFRQSLTETCRKLQLPCISVLDPVFVALSGYLGVEARGQPGRQHMMDAEYFSRIDAMHFAIAHDDGQMIDTMNQADVVLVGVSRTSKTPTCQYLANRGIKAANYPLVPTTPPPPGLLTMTIGCGEYLGQIFSTARASRSVLPPAEKGTMTLIGLDGNLSWDTAGPARASAAIKVTTKLTIKRFIPFLLSTQG